LEEHPVGAARAEYDCVLSSLCLEAACSDEESYATAMRNLASLAKPGAPVVIGGVLGESFYEFGGQRFPVLRLTPEIVQRSIEAAGCTVHKFYEQRLADVVGDAYAIFVMEACKL
jgi:nicotinamide N-methyltransferase